MKAIRIKISKSPVEQIKRRKSEYAPAEDETAGIAITSDAA